MLLFEITDQFDQFKLKYALVGRYALALHKLVRATMDVDFVLSLKQKDFELAEKLLGQLGLQSRLPVKAEDVIKMRKEFIENRNLIAWSFVDYKNPSRQVDILITQDLKEIETVKVSVSGRKINVASLEQLLKMKQLGGRPQDLVGTKPSFSPEEALRFLEDIRLLRSEIDEPTLAISLRVPNNVLRALKLKAKAEGKKYQSLMIEYLRQGLRSK